MNALFYILQKEFRQILRDKTIIPVIFIMPAIQLIIMPLAANFDIKNVNIAIVDQDRSLFSQKLISKIGASGYFRIVGLETAYPAALRLMEDDKADLILQIPPHAEQDLVRQNEQRLGLTVDGINGTKAGLGSAYLTQIISDFNNDVRVKLNANLLQASPQGVIGVVPINWFNPLARYTYYMVPGILVLLLTMVGGFLSALNIVKEKEIGTIEQINVTPIQKWQFILGKLIPFWVMGLIAFTIGLLIARFVYGIVPEGSLAVLYLFAAVYLVAVLGFGLLISTYSQTQVQAMFLAFFFIMIFMLMSGLFSPLNSMPGWSRAIANLTPVTHFIKVVRMVVLKGSTLADIRPELLYEVLFAIGLNAWAIFNYRKTS